MCASHNMLPEQPNCSLRSEGESGIDRPQTEAGNRRSKRRSRRSSRSKLQALIEDLPGWWLAFLLVAAPWAYGTTFPETKVWLAKALCVLGGVFLVSLVLRGRPPRISWVSVGLSILILGYGWFMTWNAKLVYDPRLFYFHPGSPHLPSWPGSVDHKTSAAQMLLITGLFCAFWVASDLGTRDRWRNRLWLVLSLSGVSIMLLGLAQRLSSAPGIFWRTDLDCGKTFFATYRYHGNAGAFINIILPFVAAQTVTAFRRDSSDFGKVFWVLGLLAVLASACVNLSRAATVISVGVVALFLIWQLFEIVRRRGRGFNVAQIVILFVIVGGASWLLVQEVGFGDAYKHWQELGGALAENFRYIVYDTIEHRVLPDSSWWGFGPNTFSLVFPFYTTGLGWKIWGFWEQAHQDYLQTLMEWGYCGAAVWFLLFGNAVTRAIYAFWRKRRSWDGRLRAFAVAGLLALASVLIHATVDFPMQIASLQLYTTVVLGMLAALQYAESSHRRRFQGDSRHRPARRTRGCGMGGASFPRQKGVMWA
jgi:O-antigen ligase